MADRLSEMVDELFDVSRIEAGRIQFALPVRFRLPRRPGCERHASRKRWSTRRLSSGVKIPDDIPNVLADPGRLMQIITNLMSNALKYTLEGYVDVNGARHRRSVQVDISDTGIGMTEDDQAQLFTRFLPVLPPPRASEIRGHRAGLHHAFADRNAWGAIWSKAPSAAAAPLASPALSAQSLARAFLRS